MTYAFVFSLMNEKNEFVPGRVSGDRKTPWALLSSKQLLRDYRCVYFGLCNCVHLVDLQLQIALSEEKVLLTCHLVNFNVDSLGIEWLNLQPPKT